MGVCKGSTEREAAGMGGQSISYEGRGGEETLEKVDRNGIKHGDGNIL